MGFVGQKVCSSGYAVFSGNIDQHPINLMLSFGTDAHVTSTAELANYDFFDITPNKYMGKLI